MGDNTDCVLVVKGGHCPKPSQSFIIALNSPLGLSWHYLHLEAKKREACFSFLKVKVSHMYSIKTLCKEAKI